MHMFLKAAAALLAVGVATTAHAAVVTRSYEVTGLFKDAPLAKVTTSFDLTFDTAPTMNGVSAVEISNFTSDGGAPFSNPLVYSFRDDTSGTTREKIWIGGNDDATGVTRGTDDFMITLLNDGGNLQLQSMLFTAASIRTTWRAGDLAIKDVTGLVPVTPGNPGTGGPIPDPVAGAVPEPATWAMMILGFGVVGGSMRSRPKLALRTA